MEIQQDTRIWISSVFKSLECSFPIVLFPVTDFYESFNVLWLILWDICCFLCFPIKPLRGSWGGARLNPRIRLAYSACNPHVTFYNANHGAIFAPFAAKRKTNKPPGKKYFYLSRSVCMKRKKKKKKLGAVSLVWRFQPSVSGRAQFFSHTYLPPGNELSLLFDVNSDCAKATNTLSAWVILVDSNVNVKKDTTELILNLVNRPTNANLASTNVTNGPNVWIRKRVITANVDWVSMEMDGADANVSFIHFNIIVKSLFINTY